MTGLSSDDGPGATASGPLHEARVSYPQPLSELSQPQAGRKPGRAVLTRLMAAIGGALVVMAVFAGVDLVTDMSGAASGTPADSPDVNAEDETSKVLLPTENVDQKHFGLWKGIVDGSAGDDVYDELTSISRQWISGEKDAEFATLLAASGSADAGSEQMGGVMASLCQAKHDGQPFNSDVFEGDSGRLVDIAFDVYCPELTASE